jgi:transposase InsO family protein
MKRSREEGEKARRPDERGATDVVQIRVGEGTYFVTSFMEEYSRYLVHFKIASGRDGITISAAGLAAIRYVAQGSGWPPLGKPEIRTDNGSGCISREFKMVLKEHGLGHHRIRPDCPEESGLMERLHRPLR